MTGLDGLVIYKGISSLDVQKQNVHYVKACSSPLSLLPGGVIHYPVCQKLDLKSNTVNISKYIVSQTDRE